VESQRLVDEWGTNGSFLILGSASRDLLKQSSESLAGRINYKRLTPFLWEELKRKFSIEKYFAQGGFPRSLLANDAEISYEWRENFISTYLEIDFVMKIKNIVFAIECKSSYLYILIEKYTRF
jgi:predicted AAA+ superfamily ATPase